MGQLAEQACSNDTNFLTNKQVTNPFGNPFKKADSANFMLKAASFTEKSYPEELESLYSYYCY